MVDQSGRTPALVYQPFTKANVIMAAVADAEASVVVSLSGLGLTDRSFVWFATFAPG